MTALLKDPGYSKIWKLHASESEEHDKALVEGWKTNTDSILIFVRSTYLIFPHALLTQAILR